VHDSMTMELVAEALSAYKMEVFLHNREILSIDSVLILRDSQPLYKEDILYLCEASDLKAFKIDTPVNMLCICDSPVDGGPPSGARSNLILIREPLDIAQAYEKVNSLVTKYHKLCRWYIKLNNMLISNKGLQSIVNAASAVFGNPIIVQDNSFKLLCHSKNVEVDEWVWNRIVDMKFTPYEIVKHIKNGDFAKVYNSHLPVFIAKDEYIPNDTLCSRIDVLGKAVGHVSLIGYSRPMNRDDGEYLKILSDVISQQLQRNDLIQYTKGMIYESFFIDLLDGKITDKLSIENEMKILGFGLRDIMQILTIKSPPEIKDRIPPFYIRDLLNNELIDSKSILYHDDIVILVSGSKNPLPASKLTAIEKLLRENQLIGGLSRCFQDVSKLNIYYSQSIKAIDFGIQTKDPGIILRYDDYYIDDAIDITTKTMDYKVLCAPLLFKLLEYDKANNTDFTKSLYAYLSCGLNLVKSAERLNIHRNSMDYRMKKIQDLFDLDLTDPEAVFSIHFSFKILIHHGEFKSKTDEP